MFAISETFWLNLTNFGLAVLCICIGVAIVLHFWPR